MCILFIANKIRKDYPLIIAANRDEFYARPTSPSQFWEEHPHMLAGRDLEANGTWMGVTRNGKFAALTNVRQPNDIKPNAVSRGELVVNWLSNSTGDSLSTYASTLQNTRTQYNGYNLVFGQLTSCRDSKLTVYNNVTNEQHSIEDGVIGLSNADVVTPWPKVMQGVNALTEYTKSTQTIDTEALFSILRQDNKAADEALPNTGIGYEWEKALSSIFIQTPEYGTRTSTLLLVDSKNTVTWLERQFSALGDVLNTREYTFGLEAE